jgi:hypothetical protein
MILTATAAREMGMSSRRVGSSRIREVLQRATVMCSTRVLALWFTARAAVSTPRRTKKIVALVVDAAILVRSVMKACAWKPDQVPAAPEV